MFSYPVLIRCISSGVGGALAAKAGGADAVRVKRVEAAAALRRSRRDDEVAWIAVEEDEATRVDGRVVLDAVKAEAPDAIAAAARRAMLDLTMMLFL